MNNKKRLEFGKKLASAMLSCFTDEENENYISPEEVENLEAGDELYDAIVSIAPYIVTGSHFQGLNEDIMDMHFNALRMMASGDYEIKQDKDESGQASQDGSN